MAAPVDDEIRNLSRQLAERNRELDVLEAEAARLAAEAAELRRRVARVEGSVVWGLFQRLRGGFYGAIGEHSLVARGLSHLLRAIGRSALPGQAPEVQPEPEPTEPPEPTVRFPAFVDPVVSLIVEGPGEGEQIEPALRAIADSTAAIPYEVILAGPGDGGQRPEPRGRFVALLDARVQVQPGWLEALVACAESAPDVGAVSPKVLYGDGTLREAGAIAWRDGSGSSYGRGGDAGHPAFNFRRDVDYGSIALLAPVEAWSAWREAGETPAPGAPREAALADLCFAVREAGLRVVYEPAATVVRLHDSEEATDPGDEPAGEVLSGRWAARLGGEQYERSAASVRDASDRCRGPRVLVVDHRVPRPDRDSGSLRMLHVLRSLRSLGCRVTFLPDNMMREPYTTELQALGVEVLYGQIELVEEIRARRDSLSLAIVGRPHVAPRYVDLLREVLPDACIAYDTVDLHYLRELRRAELEGLPVAKAAALREIEFALARASDVTIVVTEEEREQLAAALPGVSIEVIPNANPVADEVPPADARSGLVFVGSFEHTPNIDAVEYLVQEIMPLVWSELGDVALSIVGADPPPHIRSLATERVSVLGWVEDLDPLLRGTRAMVAPMRYGAGMKGKITQSLASGLPVATTTIGAEGLGAVDGRHLLVGDRAGDFVSAVVRLLRDDALWTEVSEAGRQLARERWSPEVMRECVRRLLDRSLSGELARLTDEATFSASPGGKMPRLSGRMGRPR